MSLQVWLPLNGNTNNQGLSGHTLSGSPASWGTGKIGKCATFTGSVSNVIYNNTTDFNYTDNFSYCVWINQNYSSSAGTPQYAFTNGRADAGGYGYGICIYNASRIGVWFGTQQIGVDCPANEWHHIALTVSGAVIKVYKDGMLYTTLATATLPTYSDGNGLGIGCFHYASNIYPYYGSLNDFRIYDHCLSPKEVKEIAKGLVCHYKLSGFGGENLIPKSRITNKGCTTFTYDSESNVYNCVAPTGSDGWGHGIYFARSTPEISVAKGQTVCFSLEVKPDVDCTCSVDVNNIVTDGSQPNGNDNDDISARTRYGFSLKANVWNKLYWTYTAKSYDLYDAASNWGIVTTNLSNAVNFQLRNIKVEYGNKPTQWVPNSTDAIYSALGYNDGIEADCSGYGNNGTKSGTITWSSDTRRYIGSYSFTTKAHYKVPCPLVSPQQFSCSFWVKPVSLGGYAMIASNYNNPASGFWLAVNCEGSGLWFYNGNYARSNKGTLTLNTWYHACLVFNKGVITWYQNGESAGTTDLSSSTTTLGISSYISIGNGYTGTSWNTDYHGKISDFRIYATALSADDIKALYNVSASIDKSGALMAYEFEEV